MPLLVRQSFNQQLNIDKGLNNTLFPQLQWGIGSDKQMLIMGFMFLTAFTVKINICFNSSVLQQAKTSFVPMWIMTIFTFGYFHKIEGIICLMSSMHALGKLKKIVCWNFNIIHLKFEPPMIMATGLRFMTTEGEVVHPYTGWKRCTGEEGQWAKGLQCLMAGVWRHTGPELCVWLSRMHSLDFIETVLNISNFSSRRALISLTKSGRPLMGLRKMIAGQEQEQSCVWLERWNAGLVNGSYPL